MTAFLYVAAFGCLICSAFAFAIAVLQSVAGKTATADVTSIGYLVGAALFFIAARLPQ